MSLCASTYVHAHVQYALYTVASEERESGEAMNGVCCAACAKSSSLIEQQKMKQLL